MDFFAGVDIGASAAKAAIIDDQGRLLARTTQPSGVDYALSASACLQAALAEARLERSALRAVFSTGYGRDNVPWAQGKMTEIACHGRGAFFHFPRRITVIDIGAQDSKVIHLDAAGRRVGFKMNRKCAAGTGAFLEEIAHRLCLPLDQLNRLAEEAQRELALSSFCTVFAATEILEKIRAGEPVANIVKGAFRSVVKRILEMDAPQGELVMTGGVVAHNSVVANLVEEEFGQRPLLPPHPQHIGAFGAALFARDYAAERKAAPPRD